MKVLILPVLFATTLACAADDPPAQPPEIATEYDVAAEASDIYAAKAAETIEGLKAEVEALKLALEDATKPDFEPIRIDCGSVVPWTDPAGNVWSPDPTQGKGTTFSAPLKGDDAAKQIEQVYRTERYGAVLAYRITVPPGSYKVSLKFREGYFTAVGRRVFSVSVGGAVVNPALDVFKAAGGKDFAYVLEADAKPNADGQIVIELSRISSTTDVPTISGIEIFSTK